MKQIKRIALVCGMVVTVLSGCKSFHSVPEKIDVLILSGQNNHNWQKTTPVLKEMLESNGRFRVTITESPETMTNAILDGVELILSNWNSYGKKARVKQWSEEAQDAFINFIEEGGGLTVVHAGGTSFPEWKEYHQIVGATWGKGSGHGPVHEFDVKLAEPHIITQSMEDFRINEELWHTMQVNGDIRVLATAFSPKDKRGSGKEEPVMFVTEYGNGRCFNLVLGAFAHTMKAAPEFEKLLLRGSEWAATGAIAD